MQSIKFLTLFYFLTFFTPPNYLSAQVTVNILSTETDMPYIAGCSEAYLEVQVCNVNADTDPVINFYAGPQTAFISQFWTNPQGPSEGNFTTFGANNAHLIGSMDTFDEENNCQTLEFSFTTSPLPGGANADEFVFYAWNANSPACNPIQNLGQCNSSTSICAPCQGPLCTQVCFGVPFDFSLPGNSSYFMSTSTDNTISEIYNNQAPIVFAGSSSANAQPSDCNIPLEHIIIQEDLIVDENWCMNSNGPRKTIVFEAGKKITIQPGFELTLVNVNIESCSEIFWDAIEVLPGATLWMVNCNIKDGHNAIRLHEGTRLYVENCNFTDNYVSIFGQGIGPDLGLHSWFRLNGTSFSGSGQLATPFVGQVPTPQNYPFAGVQLDNYGKPTGTPLVIGPELNSGINTFTNMYNGIVSWNSSFFLIGGKISDLIFNPEDVSSDLKGYGVYANGDRGNFNLVGVLSSIVNTPDILTFDNMLTGVSLNNTNGRVFNVVMDNLDTGIEVQRCIDKNMDIAGNTIDASRFGIQANFNTPLMGRIDDNNITINSTNVTATDNFQSAGIACSEINSRNKRGGWNIRENTIDLVNADKGIVYLNGPKANISENTIQRTGNFKRSYTLIDVRNTPFTNISCNTLTGKMTDEVQGNNTIGINAVRLQDASITCNTVDQCRTNINFSLPSGQIDFQANTMSNGAIGLVLEESAIIGGQSHEGNCFMDNTEFEASHGASSGDDVALSKFTVKCSGDDNASICICPPIDEIDSGSGDPLDFFQQTSIGITQVCEDENCSEEKPQNPDEPIADLYDIVATGQQVYAADRPQMERAIQYDLFGLLDGPEQNINNAELQTFYANLQNSDLDKLYQAWVQQTVVVVPSELLNALESNTQTLIELENSYYQGLITDSEYTAERNQLNIDIEDVREELDQLYQGYEEARENEINDKLDLLSQVQATNVYDANMKWALEKSLTAKSLSFIDFSAAEWVDIYNLAIQCPENAGDAVFLARSLYHLNEWLDFDRLEDCDTVVERSNSLPTKVHSAEIYPNPSADFINLTWAEAEQGLLVLTDVQGRVILSSAISQGTNTIDLSKIDTGLYFYQIMVDSKLRQNGKIVIAK